MDMFWLNLLVFLLNVHIISIKLLGGKLRVKGVIAAGLLILPFLILTFVFTGDPLRDVFVLCTTFFGYIAPIFTLKNIKKIKIIYIAFLYFAISFALATSCLWIIQIFTTNNLILMIADVLLHCLLLALCIVFSTNFVFSKAKQYIDLISIKLKTLLLVSVWLSNAFALFISAYAFESQRTLSLTLAEVFAASIIIMVGIMWPLIIVGNSLNASYKADLDSLDGQMHAQVKQYELMAKANQDIRQFKHDFKNLRAGLTVHLQSGDVQGALEFLENCGQSIQNEYILYETGNLIADALLREKQTAVQKDGVQINFSGLIPGKGISPVELCVVLGNLLDNALEACAEMPRERVISISSKVNNGFMFLQVSNPVKEDVPIHGNTLPTSKKDKKNHGIGLVSVQNAVQKYDGTLKLSCADKIFLVKVSMYLNGQD